MSSVPSGRVVERRLGGQQLFMSDVQQKPLRERGREKLSQQPRVTLREKKSARERSKVEKKKGEGEKYHVFDESGPIQGICSDERVKTMIKGKRERKAMQCLQHERDRVKHERALREEPIEGGSEREEGMQSSVDS